MLDAAWTWKTEIVKCKFGCLLFTEKLRSMIDTIGNYAAKRANYSLSLPFGTSCDFCPFGDTRLQWLWIARSRSWVVQKAISHTNRKWKLTVGCCCCTSCTHSSTSSAGLCQALFISHVWSGSISSIETKEISAFFFSNCTHNYNKSNVYCTTVNCCINVSSIKIVSHVN